MIKELSNVKLNHNKVIINGHDSMVHIEGVYLEAALSFNERYILLFVTCDCPFEEILNIYLMDTQRNLIVDQAIISQQYSPGLFTDLIIRSKNTLSFEFMIEGEWIIELLETPKKSIRNLFSNRFVKRPFSLFRYFNIVNRQK
ncbi:hypothetical protein C7375_101268 [Frischella perrara]|uniref:Uncharacterized protein n=2 Tax=Frischella perrara TaxID=1267021 RepID=A0A0A7S1C4_FRIPE|nr:hypothetical protein [Frischella perrara]AJA45263.1 hypothetical protein FPB0191_01444 [Frischella perrara]PWV66285.1 hypothetical protein C7375_101268 [Frischella perrara]